MSKLSDAINAKREWIEEGRQLLAELPEKLRVAEIELRTLEEAAKLVGEEPSESALAVKPMTRGTASPGIRKKVTIYGRGRPPPPVRQRIHDPIETLSIEALIIKAMMQNNLSGSTSNAIREFLKTEWNADATSNSFSVAMNKLGHLGEVYTKNRLWYLTDKETEQ